jgi:hypothetical protein
MHYEKLHNLYFSLYKFREIKSGWIKCKEYVNLTEEIMSSELETKDLKEKHKFLTFEVKRKIILKFI